MLPNNLLAYFSNGLFHLGLYINQSPGGQGLESWVNQNDSIDDEDVVLYHSFGMKKSFYLELCATTD